MNPNYAQLPPPVKRMLSGRRVRNGRLGNGTENCGSDTSSHRRRPPAPVSAVLAEIQGRESHAFMHYLVQALLATVTDLMRDRFDLQVRLFE